MTEKFTFPLIFAQTSARYFLIYAFIYGLFSMNYYLIAMSIFGVINGIFNFVCKKGFEFLYDKLKVKNLPILGRGQRPIGFKNCSNTPDCESIPDAFAFGMPSGHAQTAWFIFIFVVLYLNDIINNKKKTAQTNTKEIYYKLWLAFSIIIGLVISFYISYSRVANGCHTIQQVILGSIIGLVFGTASYFLSKVIIEK